MAAVSATKRTRADGGQLVTLVSQWYPPEPTVVPESIALSLQSEGLSVEVLTGIPNYPTGEVAEGYSARRRMREVLQGVNVHRTPLYASHDSNPARRVANYASWALSSALFGQRLLRRSDAVLVFSTPATVALPAMAAKVLWGTPYVLLIEDVWPDSMFASGLVRGAKGRAVWRLVDLFVQRTYAMADHVAVISPGMVDLLEGRGVPREKLSLVYNWLHEDGEPGADPSHGTGPTIREIAGIPDAAQVFLYAGNHGHAQALHTVVEAFTSDSSGDAHLVMLGGGVTKKDLIAQAAGNPRVHFLDPVSRTEAARLARTADVQVVSLADDPLFAVTMPSKFQSALASGQPVLAVAAGDVANVLTEHRAGFAARPGDAASVADAVARFREVDADELRAMGERGANAYQTQMSRALGAPRLTELLRAAARRRSRGRATPFRRS